MISIFSSPAKAAEGSAYDYQFNTLIGHKPLPLSQFKGKVVMVIAKTESENGKPIVQFFGLETELKTPQVCVGVEGQVCVGQ